MDSILSRNNSYLALRSALIPVLGLLCASPARSQDTNLEPQRAALTQVGQALSRVVVKARKVNEQLGYGFYEGGCLFGVKLRPGTNATEKFALQAGQKYVFIGGGDKTARNIDLVMRDASGRIVAQDIEADAAPFILFQPRQSGTFALSLNLKSGWKGPAFCAVTVLRNGGTSVPLGRIVEAAIRMDYASFDTFNEYKGGSFNQTPGTWALYGSVLKQGQSLSTAPKKYAAINRGVLAVGDGSSRDLDLILSDGTGKAIAFKTKSGASPKITQKLPAGAYSVHVSNKNSAGPSLIMAVLLNLPPKPATAPIPTPAPTEVAPNPIPSPIKSNKPEDCPFEGNWKGDFAAETGRVGALKMQIGRYGDLTGHITYPNLKIAAKFKGTVTLNGAFHFTFTQSKKETTVEGILHFKPGGDQIMEGKASFSTNGTSQGETGFSLDRQD